MQFPIKKYDVIYADPPWQYSSRGPRSGRFGKLDYKDMNVSQLADLPVEQIAKPDCALFMWVTSAHFPQALQLIETWGFKYVRIDSVWKKTKDSGKPHASCGPWGMNDAEFVVMAVKGHMCAKQAGKRNSYTVVEAPFTGLHSEKPNVFRQRIRKRFKNVDRIELFARKRFDGWDCWGDEC